MPMPNPQPPRTSGGSGEEAIKTDRARDADGGSIMTSATTTIVASTGGIATTYAAGGSRDLTTGSISAADAWPQWSDRPFLSHRAPRGSGSAVDGSGGDFRKPATTVSAPTYNITTGAGVWDCAEANAAPVSASRYYKILKAIFDEQPIYRDSAPTALFTGDAHGGEWEDSTSSPTSEVPAPPPLSAASAAPATAATGVDAVDVLSTSVRRFHSAANEDQVAAARARLPHSVFTLTEFTTPVSGEDSFEVAATVLAQCIRNDTASNGSPATANASATRTAAAAATGHGSGSADEGVTFIVSAGLRGCGALAHAVARILGVPYSLSDWYPDGSVGDCRVDRCRGIGGPGWVYLNGVPPHSRVAVVMDVMRSGATAARLVEGVRSIEGCSVVGVYTVAAMVQWRPPRPRVELGMAVATTASAAVVEAEEKLNGYYRCLQTSTWQLLEQQEQEHQPQQHTKKAGGRAGGRATAVRMRAELTRVPPLRALFLISVAGERTHVLTRAERDAELNALLPPDNTPGQRLPTQTHAQTQTHRQRQQLQLLLPESLLHHLRAQYQLCFPLECQQARRLPIDAVAQLKRMPAAELETKRRRVAAAFTGVPIVRNDAVGGYPYCFFTLTDFKPALTPSLVEDMADIAVHEANFQRCEVLVSEGDRGGGPLVHAISMRTHQPYVIASWSLPQTPPEKVSERVRADEHPGCDAGRGCHQGAGASSDAPTTSGVIQVGFGGSHCELSLAGLEPGTRCAFVDDMLSSGGTAEAVLRCVTQLGAAPLEAVFASEKLYPRHRPHTETDKTGSGGNRGRKGTWTGGRLPARKGRDRLAGLFPQTCITCLVQFVVEGQRTVEPPCRVGE